MKVRISAIALFTALLLMVIAGCRKDDMEPKEPFENLQDKVTTEVVSTLPRIEVANGNLTIFLSVTDQKGLPIIGLNKLNFEVQMINDAGVQVIDGIVLNSTGGTGTPHNIAAALTMDYSGSMFWDTLDVPNMKSAVHSFIDLKSTSDILEILKFDHNVHVMQSFTSDTGLLHFAVNDDTSFQFMGSTAFYQACMDGLMDTHDTIIGLTGWFPAVIGFTDGKNNQAPLQPDTLVNLALQYQIPIYTVAYGSFTGQNNPDTVALQFLADTTGGRYFFTPNSAGLQTLYQYINGQLTNAYVISFPFGSKANATIRVKTTYKCGNGTMTSSAEKKIWY